MLTHTHTHTHAWLAEAATPLANTIWRLTANSQVSLNVSNLPFISHFFFLAWGHWNVLFFFLSTLQTRETLANRGRGVCKRERETENPGNAETDSTHLNSREGMWQAQSDQLANSLLTLTYRFLCCFAKRTFCQGWTWLSWLALSPMVFWHNLYTVHNCSLIDEAARLEQVNWRKACVKAVQMHQLYFTFRERSSCV